MNQTLDVMAFDAAVQSTSTSCDGPGNTLGETGLTTLMLLDGMKTEIAKPAVSGNGS